MKTFLFRLGLATALLMGAGVAAASAADTKPVVAFLAKAKGNAYFLSCKTGADRAAKELGAELLFDGPIEGNAAKQAEIVKGWIARKVTVLAVAVEDKEGLSLALREAQRQGIPVITYDADAMPDARTFFVNQATAEGIGFALMDEAARLQNAEGEFAVITASMANANQREWMKHIEARLKEKYPKMKLVVARACDDRKDKAQSETSAILKAYPNVKVVMATCSPGVPGAAEAVKQAGRTGQVKVIGLGLPNENKPYVHAGITESVILWNTGDLGYLTVHAAVALARGTLQAGAKSFKAGSLGELTIAGDNILLGKPFLFTKRNIDQFDF